MEKCNKPIQIDDLAEEIVPAGALVETKQDAIHYITVLVLGIGWP